MVRVSYADIKNAGVVITNSLPLKSIQLVLYQYFIFSPKLIKHNLFKVPLFSRESPVIDYNFSKSSTYFKATQVTSTWTLTNVYTCFHKKRNRLPEVGATNRTDAGICSCSAGNRNNI
jgi:hypothetical protein